MPDTKISSMTPGAPALLTDSYHAARSGTDVKLSNLDILNLSGPSPYSVFFGSAKDQILGDSAFYDRSYSLNNALFGANLSNAAAWANPGFVTTVAPAGGSTDSVIRVPPINFDYAGGQKLVVWWLGKAAAPGSPAAAMGDGNNPGASYPGIKIRANTNGTLQPILYDANNTTGAFGGATSDTVFDGTLHSYAFALDGAAQTFAQWVDETVQGGITALAPFYTGTAFALKNNNTFNLGASSPAVAGSTDGMVIQTRGLAILRFPSTVALPSLSKLTNLFKQLRTNPSRIAIGSAFQ